MKPSGEAWYLNGRRRPRKRRLQVWVWVAAPVAAVLFQTYAPLFAGWLSYLELPLLITIYLSTNRRSPVAGALIGMPIGLLQDALAHWPVGLLGMVKTLAGFAACAAGIRFDADNPAVRVLFGFVFFLGHQILFWVLRRTLLNEPAALNLGVLLLAALLNGALAAPLFALLDKLRESA
jgi:rod shape-determining protein MreD